MPSHLVQEELLSHDNNQCDMISRIRTIYYFSVRRNLSWSDTVWQVEWLDCERKHPVQVQIALDRKCNHPIQPQIIQSNFKRFKAITTNTVRNAKQYDTVWYSVMKSNSDAMKLNRYSTTRISATYSHSA